MKNIEDISESLSDFNSCVESSDLSNRSDDDEAAKESEKNGYSSLNDKKRGKKAKRKLKLTPGKDQFLKKKNIQLSH